MKVSAQYAEEHFADIVNTAMRGEDVEIATPEQPSLRLTLVQSSATVPASHKVRPLGRLKGLMHLPTDAEWAAMDKELEELMVNAIVEGLPLLTADTKIPRYPAHTIWK